uniref:polynucleotide adenylyltransferase n=1 Tax=Scleropages formosus TaxID=113540 RepID=A0A8C9WHW8_SCLFO
MELSTDRRFHNLTQEQVQTLDRVLTEAIPIHGRGNFPTLEVRPRDIIHVVRNRLVEKEIQVRDVRLNGSTASHVLVRENGSNYKDLDIIFGVELAKQEDFQIIKDVVLGCLVDFLPQGVNKDKITVLTMKEAYVQKMVKVFNEHDRWSLISLSNNRGKNVELKFVNSLRRQFEFSVDSFQIILDRMLEFYLEEDRSQAAEFVILDNKDASSRAGEKPGPGEELPSTSHDVKKNRDSDLPMEVKDLPGSSPSQIENEVTSDEMSQCQPEMLTTQTIKAEEAMELNVQKPGTKIQEKNDLEVKSDFAEELPSVSEPTTDSSFFDIQDKEMKSLESDKLIQLEVPESTEYSPMKENPDKIFSETENSADDEPVHIFCRSPSKSFLKLTHQVPTPPKKSCKKSQMVVLKHSSPKPQRKMIKKVNSNPLSPDQTTMVNQTENLRDSLSSDEMASATQSDALVQNEEPDLTDNCSTATEKKSHDKGCQVELLDIPFLINTAVAQRMALESSDKEARAEMTCPKVQCQILEIPETPEIVVQALELQRKECMDGPKPIQDLEAAALVKGLHCVEPHSGSTPVNSASEVVAQTRELPHITVVAESMYGDFEQAMDHLRYRLIATRNPEEIRGGGLLKYSNLLVRDYKPASETEIKTLERYMCSRFFIDFPDVSEQQRKIESYLRNHFIGEESSKYDYLMTLRRVVNESTVCLMGHERRQTLNMITVLALKVLGEQNVIPNTSNVTCFYQPAPYVSDNNFSNYYIPQGQPPLIYHPYPLHIHMLTGLV